VSPHRSAFFPCFSREVLSRTFFFLFQDFFPTPRDVRKRIGFLWRRLSPLLTLDRNPTRYPALLGPPFGLDRFISSSSPFPARLGAHFSFLSPTQTFPAPAIFFCDPYRLQHEAAAEPPNSSFSASGFARNLFFPSDSPSSGRGSNFLIQAKVRVFPSSSLQHTAFFDFYSSTHSEDLACRKKFTQSFNFFCGL